LKRGFTEETNLEITVGAAIDGRNEMTFVRALILSSDRTLGKLRNNQHTVRNNLKFQPEAENWSPKKLNKKNR
jgi:hypothetical protein